MISPEDIKKLATLSRLKVSGEELPKLALDLQSILGYVSELEKVKSLPENRREADPANKENLLNIMREDKEPHQSGQYTENILKLSPRRQGNYVVVKKIL